MDLTRREFLRTATLAAGAVSASGLLVACGKEEGPAAPRSLQALADARKKAGATGGLSVFLAGQDFAVGIPNYVGFGLVRDQAGPVAGSDARVWVAPTSDPKAASAPRGPVGAPWQGYANPQASGPTGINAADLRFDRAGVWTALVEVSTQQGAMLGSTAIQVKSKPGNKAPADKAIPSKTPTVDNARGVKPICTRKPRCPFHRVTLADAIASGKPVAFIVATPAFCQSRTCGPNLEELITISKETGDRALFVHSEVYLNDGDAVAKNIVTPTFKEWAFESEPWIYLIDRSGTIASRYEGPVTAGRLRRDFAPLLS